MLKYPEGMRLPETLRRSHTNRLPTASLGFEFSVLASKSHLRNTSRSMATPNERLLFSRKPQRKVVFQSLRRKALYSFSHSGSEGGPVTLPVFKTGDWRLAVSMVRSTRTRFRQVIW